PRLDRIGLLEDDFPAYLESIFDRIRLAHVRTSSDSNGIAATNFSGSLIRSSPEISLGKRVSRRAARVRDCCLLCTIWLINDATISENAAITLSFAAKIRISRS